MRWLNKHDELALDPDAETLGVTRPLHFQARLLGAVAAGGIIGAPARYTIGRAWATPSNGFPFATLAINLFGSFLLGVILEALVRRGNDEGVRRIVRLIAGAGFCGAFTTYSTFAVGADLLVRSGRLTTAVTYVFVTLVGGLVATTAGIAIAASDHRRRLSHGEELPVDPDEIGSVQW